MTRKDLVNTNNQAVINYLNTLNFDWYDVEMDSENVNVSKIYITENMYLYSNTTNRVALKSGDFDCNFGTFSNFTIFQNGKNLILYGYSSATQFGIFAIGEITLEDGEKSLGAVYCDSSEIHFYSDNMTTKKVISTTGYVRDSVNYTQLIKAYSPVDSVYFSDIFIVYMDTVSNRFGVSELNGEEYVFAGKIAMRI